MVKLLLIYGPPAAGKLTVAGKIAKSTNFKVFHNHLTIDLVKEILNTRKGEGLKLIGKFRLDLIKAAIKEKTNIIFTFCYAHPEDISFIKKIQKAVKSNGGSIDHVLLTATKDTLLSRVKEGSRRKYKKIKSKIELSKCLSKYDLISEIPHSNSLIIDNSYLSVTKTAILIIRHFRYK